MYGLICAFIAAAVMLYLIPNRVILGSHTSKLMSYQSLLLFLPLLVVSWIAINLMFNGASFRSLAALGFTFTACLIALPRWHRYLIPSALFTALMLIALITEYF
ncbi:hypothetical protein L9G16_15355 [Shewanella sp. A25]|nr:hypothetical protein [Shewanella shenzhenensis]